jgi:hypothetical protein
MQQSMGRVVEMPRIYSTSNRIKFTDIPEKYAIPRGFKAKQSEMHSAVIMYVYEHYKNTKKYRQQVTDALNRLTFCVMQNEPPSYKWVSTDPIETMPDIDIEVVESTLGDYYLEPDAIDWDVVPSSEASNESLVAVAESAIKPSEAVSTKSNQLSKSSPAKPGLKTEVTSTKRLTNKPLTQVRKNSSAQQRSSTVPTAKEDLYIQPPKYPRFDTSRIWLSATAGSDELVIYSTLPEIPRKQNEISITTDLSQMTEQELMALYPNHIVHTRAQQMYEHYETMDYDEDVGCIIPIEGFTREQVVDNIIRYPHLFRLRKIGISGDLEPFASTIEIDGELIPASEAWDSLPESKLMPRNSEFVKEYVIRRYILEEEAGISHDYKMSGMLEPFLTLFMPCTDYIRRGYTDTLAIVKQCVTSRVHYKQSRSPILKRLERYHV